MKKYLLYLVFSAFFFSCNENEEPVSCGVENPVEDIAWIKAAIEEYSTNQNAQFSYLKQARYDGETVFFFGSCCPNCLWALIVKDCQGNVIEGDIAFEDLTSQEVIWQPSNSECVFI